MGGKVSHISAPVLFDGHMCHENDFFNWLTCRVTTNLLGMVVQT